MQINNTIKIIIKGQTLQDQKNGSYLSSRKPTKNHSQDQERQRRSPGSIRPAQIRTRTADDGVDFREGLEAGAEPLDIWWAGRAGDRTGRPLESEMGIRRSQGRGGGGTRSGSPPASRVYKGEKVAAW